MLDTQAAVFPHLFQRYRTDGVEHTIYIGDSLTERTDFSSLYHKELKLWQLRVVAEMAQASVKLQSELTVPLHVAHLILAQADPIALRFSQEEKKFNVDGAYNTRYEIIKKRIDKAHVKGSDERVTQPAKLSIFYSQLPKSKNIVILSPICSNKRSWRQGSSGSMSRIFKECTDSKP